MKPERFYPIMNVSGELMDGYTNHRTHKFTRDCYNVVDGEVVQGVETIEYSTGDFLTGHEHNIIKNSTIAKEWSVVEDDCREFVITSFAVREVSIKWGQITFDLPIKITDMYFERSEENPDLLELSYNQTLKVNVLDETTFLTKPVSIQLVIQGSVDNKTGIMSYSAFKATDVSETGEEQEVKILHFDCLGYFVRDESLIDYAKFGEPFEAM